MSETMNEQSVCVGDVWEYSRSANKRSRFTVSAVGKSVECSCDHHIQWTEDDGTPNGVCRIEPGGFYGWALISRLPTSKPACKAPSWCGFKAGDDTDSRWHAWMNSPPTPDCIANEHRFCSQPCADAASKPATGHVERKCKSFCGQTYGRLGVLAGKPTAAGMEWERNRGYPEQGPVTDDRITWCTAACRDARLPPMTAPAAEGAIVAPGCEYSSVCGINGYLCAHHKPAPAAKVAKAEPRKHDFSDPYCRTPSQGQKCKECGWPQHGSSTTAVCVPDIGWRAFDESIIAHKTKSTGAPCPAPAGLVDRRPRYLPHDDMCLADVGVR